jgi:hypothetical protein
VLYQLSYSHHCRNCGGVATIGYMALTDGSGRGGGIRTPDILLPKQARYQTALYPATLFSRRGWPSAREPQRVV